MARTVHHVPDSHRIGNCDHHDCPCSRPGYYGRAIIGYPYRPLGCTYAGPHHALSDLRYSALDLVRAARLGTRPVPTRVRPAMPAHVASERLYGASGEIHAWADLHEGRARTRIRENLRTAVDLVNTALRDGDEDAYVAADDLDLAPYRHRHSARWEAL